MRVLNFPKLAALSTAVPPHILHQTAAKEFARGLFSDTLSKEVPSLLSVFDHAQIQTRRLCVPLQWLKEKHSWKEKNDLYVHHATQLAHEVTQKLLIRTDLQPSSVDHIIFVSSTGILSPTVDARLANLIPFRKDVRRTPIWGLGCAGGAAALALARDLALADPRARILLLAVELCSLTFQREDLSKRNFIATSLFADGAAAALVVGSENELSVVTPHPILELASTRSTFWPDTLDVMGWDIDNNGFQVVFSRDIPEMVRGPIADDFRDYLKEQGLSVNTLLHLAVHPGGIKVLEAYAEALKLPATAFRHSYEVLRELGNMSSPTCLFVLQRCLEAREVLPGQTVLLSALGPGFSAQYVLMRGFQP